jgi:hypothetical protein
MCNRTVLQFILLKHVGAKRKLKCNNSFDDAYIFKHMNTKSICKKVQDLPHPLGKKGERIMKPLKQKLQYNNRDPSKTHYTKIAY